MLTKTSAALLKGFGLKYLKGKGYLVSMKKSEAILPHKFPIPGGNSIIQRKYTTNPSKIEKFENMMCKGIAKCLNIADDIGKSKSYNSGKRVLINSKTWMKDFYTNAFLQHWYVQHTISEYNRKLMNARNERAMKQNK